MDHAGAETPPLGRNFSLKTPPPLGTFKSPKKKTPLGTKFFFRF